MAILQPLLTSDPFAYNLHAFRKDSPETIMLGDFFLHSDCDGQLDEKHILCLPDTMKKLTGSPFKETPKLQLFYEFVQTSAANNCIWIFS